MKKNIVEKYIRTDIVQMESYVPGDSADTLAKKYDQDLQQLIKLNANENPYGASLNVKKALQDLSYQYYAQSDYTNLRKALARYTKMNAENIIVGSGSDELIDLILRAVLEFGDKVIDCPPTFGMYEQLVRLNRGELITVPRDSRFALNIPEIIKQSIDKKVKVIFLCNPNSPTGNLLSQEEIVTVLQTGKLVIVDEAYYEFSKTTVTPLLRTYKNLIILRTFSKWAGLAGLRVGYAMMSKKLVAQLMKIKLPFNVNIAAEKAVLATLRNLSFTNRSVQKIVNERERMYSELTSIKEIIVFKSSGNFIFIETKESDYTLLKKSFEKNKIALRYYSKINNGIRITVGRQEQNNKVLAVLNDYFFSKKYAFLDRDGTLIFEPQDTFQIDSLDRLRILDGVIKGLRALKRKGYELVMVSNQDGMGTDSFPKEQFEAPQNKMLSLFAEDGIRFTEIFICPHTYMQKCRCRKPKIGLVKKFFEENKIDKKNSFVCGDREGDRLFAKNCDISYIKMQTNGNFYKSLKEGGIV